MRTLLVAVLLLLPSVGHAQTRWVKVQDSHGQTYSIDTARVERLPSGNLSIWTKIEFQTPQVVNGKAAAYSVIQFWIDCERKRYAAVGGAVYSAEGHELDTMKVDEPKWQDIVPTTFLGAAARASCGKK